VTHSRKMQGAVGIASPVFSGANDPIGSLCVSVPDVRFKTSMIKNISSVLIDRTGRMSVSLGAACAERKASGGARDR
jgi:IclR family transcriptional regulator, acetate operon repressor